MKKTGLNSKILKGIDSNCNDPNIASFLKKLLYTEADKSEYWKYKSTYRKLIDEYVEKKEV